MLVKCVPKNHLLRDLTEEELKMVMNIDAVKLYEKYAEEIKSFPSGEWEEWISLYLRSYIQDYRKVHEQELRLIQRDVPEFDSNDFGNRSSAGLES